MSFVWLCVGAFTLTVSAGSATAQEQVPIDLPGELFSSSLHSNSEVKILDWLREGGDPDTVIDSDGNTFMHYAPTNRLSILQEAVRRGGDCNRKNSYGATPLHFASSQLGLGPGAEAVRILIQCEASPNLQRACDISPSLGGRTAEACQADPNAQDRRGDTPLHVVYEGVEKNSAPPVYNLGETVSGGGMRADILRVLLEEVGADPNIANGDGDTPLMLPIRTGSAVFSKLGHISLLLQSDADPNTRNNLGATPLIETVSQPGNYDEMEKIIALLLKHGADPDLRDGQGDTPLIRAAQHEDDIAPEMEVLLAGDADPCLRDRNGKLAYDHAQADGALLLYKAGGYPDRETGICVRDLLEAEKRENELALNRDTRRRLQSCLKTEGFDPGTPDGLFGPRVRAAIRAWQSAQGRQGMEAAGYFTQGESDALLAACRVAVPEPLCTGATGSGCWMETANQSGCHIWNPNPQPEETVTWSGGCMEGKVAGKGKAAWRFREEGQWRSSWIEGEYRDGRTWDGHWVQGDSDGNVSEGPVVDGKSNGHWVKRYSDGQVWEGPLVNGRGHGIWVRRDETDVAQCWRNDVRMDALSACGYTTMEERRMEATQRVGLRNGPGEEYSRVGLLEPGDGVDASAKLQGWLWVSKPDGRGGYVQASALTEGSRQQTALERELAGEMVSIPGGTFRMGDLSGEGDADEEPVHSVTVPAFRMGRHEVTFAQWDACVTDGGCDGYTPYDRDWGRGNRPVIKVSWDDVQGFIDWLNARTGGNFRLPTEAEWEYAVRAGSTTKYSWGNDIGSNRANCSNYDCGDEWEYTAPVGSFAANAWGLHDMHGNVWEWVQDCYNGSYQGAPSDGSAWTGGDCGRRVGRGGSWNDTPGGLRSATRARGGRTNRDSGRGFRLAQDE